MREEDMPYRDAPKSTHFSITREALNEAYSALAGCLHVLGDIANIKLGMEKLKTAVGLEGDSYKGHEPNFDIGASSEPMPPQ